MERLDFPLSSLQTDAHLHKHVLGMNHNHPRDISLDPRGFELILLPLRQKVVDRVLWLVMMCAAIGGDRLPYSVGYCIISNSR
jgi:hypothetical protein